MRSRTLGLVLLCLLMLAMPVLAGCGGDDEGEGTVNEIKYGWIWDFTGRAAAGVTQTFDGFRDYLHYVNENDPIPGIEISLLTYDTKSDPSLVPQGYEWMKNEGAHVMSAAPQDTEVLRSRFEADEIPFYALSNIQSMVDCEWLTSLYGPPELQLEVQLEWIEKNWTKYPTKPKVGFIGLAGVAFYVSQGTTVEQWATTHADKLDWLGKRMAPPTTTSWVTDAEAMMNADFLFLSMSGSPLVNLVKELRARGYQGTLMGPSETYFSFYMLMRSSLTPAQLTGTMAGAYTPWWGEDTDFMNQVVEYAVKYHRPDEMAKIYQGTGEINGWAAGMIFVDAVRRAAKDKGAENVDGKAIHEALKATDLTAEGWGNVWKLPGKENVNYFAQTIRIVQYDAATDTWVTAPNADYVYPPSLRD